MTYQLALDTAGETINYPVSNITGGSTKNKKNNDTKYEQEFNQ